MRTQRNLKRLLQRCFWHFKALKLVAWVPLLIVNVVIPLGSVLVYQKGLDYLRSVVEESTMLFLPFFSVWWVIFILREYLEADGCELLYVCQDKIKFGDALCPFLLYLANISLLYAGYSFLFPKDMPLQLLRMLCICSFFFGLTYFLFYATKSVTLTIMIVLIYYILCTLFPPSQAAFPLFTVQEGVSLSLLRRLYLPLLLSGAVLTAGGIKLNQKIAVKN